MFIIKFEKSLTRKMLSTIILRHKKENKNKCSLQPLVDKEGFVFLNYPFENLPNLNSYCLLTIDAPILSKDDDRYGLFIIDATWKYATLMQKQVLKNQMISMRSLPKEIVTAYPRKQTNCLDPKRGLASIEALYVAYKILGRDYKSLLDNYYWKENFLKMNEKSHSFFK